MSELAKRAVACKHWRWMPGMQTQDFTRVCYNTGYSARGWDHCDNTCSECDGGIVTLTSACLPELTDPATLGCLLALVRKAWNDDKIGLRWVEDDFGNDVCHIVRQRYGDWEMRTTIASSVIEAAALVNALEAAP